MEPMQEQYQAGRVPSTVQEIPGRGETLQAARQRVNQALSDAGEHAKQAVHNNPWTSIGIGFGLGVVVGALVALAASRNA